jgi:hypothetical protein
MSKSSSPRGCIWHMDRVGQTPGQKGPRADRPCFMSVWPVASRTRVNTRTRRPRRWRKLVEAAPLSRSATWLGRPTTTWCQIEFSKLVELPHDPINTPLRWKWKDTHTPYFGDSICKALILSVAARCSLVGRVVRLWGIPSLSGAFLVAWVRKLCWNPLGIDGVFWTLVDRVWELYRNSTSSDRVLTDTHDITPEWMIYQSH